jgi:hypothetical protein
MAEAVPPSFIANKPLDYRAFWLGKIFHLFGILRVN